MASSTKAIKTEEFLIEGLPFFHYTGKPADIDATSAAALAVRIFHDEKVCPRKLHVVSLGLQSGEKPSHWSILSGALDAVWDQVDRRVVQMGPINGITVNKAYDDMALPNVPFRGDHVDLKKPETLRSNANGYAAASWLAPFNSRTAPESSRSKKLRRGSLKG